MSIRSLYLVALGSFTLSDGACGPGAILQELGFLRGLRLRRPCTQSSKLVFLLSPCSPIPLSRLC